MSSETNPSWELLKKIVTANNQGKYDEMYSLIESNDFSDKDQAADAAMSCIELTPENIKANKECLIAFSEQVNDEGLSWRSQMRFAILVEMLKDDFGDHNEAHG